MRPSITRVSLAIGWNISRCFIRRFPWSCNRL